jgi:hypothetical protein
MANNCRYNKLVNISLLINPLKFSGGIMNRTSVSTLGRAAFLALFVLMILPVTTFAQRRWVARPYRNRVVIYQPRPSLIYQRRPAYTYRYNTYSQPYYSNQYYSYGYSQPYYSNQDYSYGYSQPYLVNRYAYSPAYRYSYDTYRPRYHRNRFRIGIRLR